MGTRGLFGFYHKGKYYMIYNHFDSYPEGLGLTLIEELKQAIKDGKIEEWIELLENLKVVDEAIPPTEEEKERLKEYCDLSVSTKSMDDWYCLLRHTQRSFEKVLKAGYISSNWVGEDGSPSNDGSWWYILYLEREAFIVCDRNTGIFLPYDFDHLPDMKFFPQISDNMNDLEVYLDCWND